MSEPADHEIDGAVKLLDDVDDRPRDCWALVVIAGWIAAFVNQDDDGFYPARLQFRDQRVDGLGFIAKFEAGCTAGGNNARRTLQRKPDECDGNAVELPD